MVASPEVSLCDLYFWPRAVDPYLRRGTRRDSWLNYPPVEVPSQRTCTYVRCVGVAMRSRCVCQVSCVVLAAVSAYRRCFVGISSESNLHP
jgi:hypothetical protein